MLSAEPAAMAAQVMEENERLERARAAGGLTSPVPQIAPPSADALVAPPSGASPRTVASSGVAAAGGGTAAEAAGGVVGDTDVRGPLDSEVERALGPLSGAVSGGRTAAAQAPAGPLPLPPGMPPLPVPEPSIVPPQLIQDRPVQYPESQFGGPEELDVTISFMVDERGVFTEVLIETNVDWAFKNEVYIAAEQWQYLPARQGGKAIPHEVSRTVRFVHPPAEDLVKAWALQGKYGQYIDRLPKDARSKEYLAYWTCRLRKEGRRLSTDAQRWWEENTEDGARFLAERKAARERAEHEREQPRVVASGATPERPVERRGPMLGGAAAEPGPVRHDPLFRSAGDEPAFGSSPAPARTADDLPPQPFVRESEPIDVPQALPAGTPSATTMVSSRPYAGAGAREPEATPQFQGAPAAAARRVREGVEERQFPIGVVVAAFLLILVAAVVAIRYGLSDDKPETAAPVTTAQPTATAQATAAPKVETRTIEGFPGCTLGVSAEWYKRHISERGNPARHRDDPLWPMDGSRPTFKCSPDKLPLARPNGDGTYDVTGCWACPAYRASP